MQLRIIVVIFLYIATRMFAFAMREGNREECNFVKVMAIITVCATIIAFLSLLRPYLGE